MPISQYSTPIGNSLEQRVSNYVPLPLDVLLKAGQATQQRYDLSEANDSAMQTGLASTEALAPAYKDFLNSAITGYKGEAKSLIDKYSGHLDDPEFHREQIQLLNKYKNNPNWGVIKQGNEAIKQDQDIAVKLAATGAKVYNPIKTFIGYNEDGTLKSYTPSVRKVTAWDDFEDKIKIAHASMEDMGRGDSSNVRNLTNLITAKKRDIINEGPDSSDQIAVLQQSGLSRDQAKQSLLAEVDNLSNKYAKRSEHNFAWDNLQLNYAELAAKKVAAQQEATGDLGPYLVPAKGEMNTDNDQEIPLFGKSNVNFNKPFSGTITGERIVLKPGNAYNPFNFGDETSKKTGSVNITDGTLINAVVPYSITSIRDNNGNESSKSKDLKGHLLSKDTGMFGFAGDGTMNVPFSADNIKTDSNGQYVYIDKNKKEKAYIQPQAYLVYKDNKSGSTIYKKANRDEALTYLGKDAGYFSNDGNTQRFSRLPNEHKEQIKLDLQKRGIDVRGKSDQQIDYELDKIDDYKYYQDKKAPLYAKPSTTTPITDYYFGK